MTGPRAHALDRGLALCDRLLAQHLAAAVRRYGAAALGVIDLPPLRHAPLVDEQLRVGAALYWTYEIERSGLVHFAEQLLAQVVDGRLALPIGPAVSRLLRGWWRERGRRFQPDERAALFRRVFGDTADDEVARGLRAVAGALAAIGSTPRDQPVMQLEVRLAVAARALGTALSARCVGVTAYAAREILAYVRDVIRLLRNPELARALGSPGVLWTVRQYGRTVVGRDLDPAPAVTRARGGGVILAWLATSATALAGGLMTVERDGAAVRAAEAWLAAGGGIA